MRMIQALWLFIVSTITMNINKTKNEPVRLNKQTKKKSKKVSNNLKIVYTDFEIILIVIGLLTLLVLISSIIYQTGCLESTTYYYRLGK